MDVVVSQGGLRPHLLAVNEQGFATNVQDKCGEAQTSLRRLMPAIVPFAARSAPPKANRPPGSAGG
jgi:hypothetical protein